MAKPKSRAAQIRNYLEKHPHAKANDVVKHLGVPAHAVYNVRWAMKAEEAGPIAVDGVEIPEPVAEQISTEIHDTARANVAQMDMVDWFVNKFGLDYNLGNAVKYIAMNDVALAKRYLDRAA